MNDRAWPQLDFDGWRDTCDTVHMWAQIVGKTRMALSPPVNHWWHTPLYVTPRGLTTSPIPYGSNTFSIDFDFHSHELRIETSDGQFRRLALGPRSVAEFYSAVLSSLGELGINVAIRTIPDEVPERIP